jgi:putative thioredoxin
LLRRTQDLDVEATRQAAAERPSDVAAQVAAADLELVGGHVEDAFLRLVDTVRVTSGDERNQAREHLLELFEVIGAQDPRVAAARRSLTAALF